MHTTLILVRHGETEVNAKGLMHSQNDPEKLNAKGIDQVTKTAERLKNFQISGVYTSKEERAGDSAKIISRICGVPIKKIDGMEERNWGSYSDKSWPELKEILDKMSYAQRYEFTPPDGESLIGFEKRLGNAVQKILIENRGKPTVCVSHGGAIRVLIGFLLNLPQKDRFKYEPPNASITILEYRRDKWKKIIICDTSHLS